MHMVIVLRNEKDECIGDRHEFCRYGMGSKLAGKLRMVSGPKYDGKYLHGLLRRHLGNTRLDRTLTNVVIPTFDIAYLQPTIFSSFEVTQVLIRQVLDRVSGG